ncbi:DUF4173 domain-containing protein [Deinococcus psychrotolerans]|uniref:DUF4173 domain-containing protein n=1 Tax=Deinococcus psychrotolerans TaxID=2489213 RepID=A0A3G8YEW4_9DEIO|nr:DUF4153 domain-containing protein [Deinococcus psychrotolerans]AZI43420.1 DUF4173 domain-containing protein [Deinococcus psychrotolerans]
MTEADAPPTSPLPVLLPPPPLPAPPRDALPLLLTVGLSLLAVALTRNSDFGLNGLLLYAALVGSVLAVLRWRGVQLQKSALGVLGLGLACGLGVAVRSGPLMTGLNLLALAVALALGTAYAALPGLSSVGVGGVLLTGLLSMGRMVYGFPTLLGRFPWTRLRGRPQQRHYGGRMLVGVLLTIPVLLVFGALLSSADERFGQLLSRLFEWNLGDLPSILLQLGVWLFFLGGLVYAALLARRAAPDLSHLESATPRLGLIELGLPLISLSLLFCVYLGLQASSFFGSALVVGLTYSEAARQGFGQLTAVAALTLALLLLTHTLLRRELRLGWPYRLISAAVLLPLSLVILSAYLKLSGYISAYGLSEIRVLGALFLSWVSVSLLAFALLGWRGRLERFAYFSLISGLSFIAGLNVVNPGRLIASVNIQRDIEDVRTSQRSSHQEANFFQLLDLGADAVPLITANLNRLTSAGNSVSTASEDYPSKPSRGQAEQALRERFPSSADWRSWNWARWRAGKQVESLGY